MRDPEELVVDLLVLVSDVYLLLPRPPEDLLTALVLHIVLFTLSYHDFSRLGKHLELLSPLYLSSLVSLIGIFPDLALKIGVQVPFALKGPAFLVFVGKVILLRTEMGLCHLL